MQKVDSKILVLRRFITKHLTIIFCGGFIVLILLLLTLLVFELSTGIHLKKTELHENRAFAEFPDLATTPLVSLPRKIEDYFDDNLPLRSQIIYKYRKLWKNCMSGGYAPIKGKNGHYFRSINTYRMLQNPIEPTVLYESRAYFTGLFELLKSKNIDFMVLVAPTKTHFYPEYLPDWGKNINTPWVDQIINFNISDTSVFDIEGLNTVLTKYKEKAQLFNKVGDLSHWNGNSVAYIYQFICDKLDGKSYFTKIPFDKVYSMATKSIDAGVNGKELVPWLVINEDGLTYKKNNYSSSPRKWENCDIIINDDVEQGSILIISDSYLKATHQNQVDGSNGVIFPLAKNFHKYVHVHNSYVTQELLEELIANEKPDIVVLEFVERAVDAYSANKQANISLCIAGDRVLKQSIFEVTPEVVRTSISENNVVNTGDSLPIIETLDKSVKLSLPLVRTGSNGRVVVVARLRVSGSTEFMLSYKNKFDSGNMLNKTVKKIEKEDSYLYFDIIDSPNSYIEVTLEIVTNKRKVEFLSFSSYN